MRAIDTGNNHTNPDLAFVASVTNTVPTVVGTGIPNQAVEIGETTVLSTPLTAYFADAETSVANLSLSVSSSNTEVVSAATIDPASKKLSLTVPTTKSDGSDVTDGDEAIIAVTATDESGKLVIQTFKAIAAIRPVFKSATYSATLDENDPGSGMGVAAVAIADLSLTDDANANAKSYTLVSVSVNGGASQTSDSEDTTDYDKFEVAGAANTAAVTYIGGDDGEDYEALKARLADCMPDMNEPLKCEPTYTLVIRVTDTDNNLMATVNTTVTVAVIDANDAPTYVSASQTPSSPTLLEQRPSNDADTTAATDDDALPAGDPDLRRSRRRQLDLQRRQCRQRRPRRISKLSAGGERLPVHRNVHHPAEGPSELRG